MRAAIYERTGPATEVLRIEEVPTPTPGPGEVRVKLSWSGVNPSDVKARAGTRSSTLPFPRIVPHSDGAGMIDQVGDGVDLSRVGERVWTWNAAWGRPFGTAAEFVVLPAEQTVSLPAEVDTAVGACLGIPVLTAYHAVTLEGGVADQHVLVVGGAGAVGHYAVQLAKVEGARQVIATVSGPEKAELAHAAGADLVVNYRTEDVVARCLRATGGVGLGRIIEVDAAVNIATDIAMLRPHGDVVVYGSGSPEITVPFPPALLKSVGLRFFIVYELTSSARARAIAAVGRLLETGRLVHNVAALLPLTQIARAHDLVERGRAIGNVVLAID